MANRKSADPPRQASRTVVCCRTQRGPVFLTSKTYVKKKLPRILFFKIILVRHDTVFTGNFYRLLEKVAVSIVTEVDFSEDGGCRLRRNVKVSNFVLLLTVHLSIFVHKIFVLQ